MDLAFIDLTANQGDSVFHKSSAVSKFLFTICMIIAIIIAKQPIHLTLILVLLIIGYLLARISLLIVGHYALYPAFFSMVFALFKFSYSVAAGVTVILKAVTAALALLLLIFTTPYLQIFGILGYILPDVLVDGMFFTYRIFFILIKEVQNLLTNIKLKGGYHPFNVIFNIKNLAGALGVLFIHSFDLSERMYKILIVRGYTGSLKVKRKVSFHWWDYLLILVGVIVIFAVVIL
ncbi:hypothetical protein BBF96_02340 [Anoxybacter fermentans]|uniref:Cobalt ABC transporter permease n=1 Tax=Anoxybacter fermentans TaxID=1323375 RepID=A0A3S9SVR3_9FIRM|nr:energy-coupling factor transporter transmembrane component T [Anoxybacter fermentans]AZR72330.1 hypothetical protein BBF96_02340 [Anoxybacter fermentans]